MRALALALVLVAEACGSSNTGSCTNAPPGSPCDSVPDDAAPFDTLSDGARDVGPDTGPSDVAEASIADATDVSAAPEAEASTDVAAVVDHPSDARTDASAPDARADVAAVDAPPGECAAVERACRVNADCAMCTPVRGLTWCCGGIGGRAACVVPNGDGTCPGVVTDAGPARPDVRVNCEEIVRCTRHEDCWAMCADNPVVSQWCCGASGVCGVTSSGSCMR